MANDWVTVLYTGVTNNLVRRVAEHKESLAPGFTKRYHVTRLLYYEMHQDITRAIEREKQIKRWRREKKTHLIENMNPRFEDLTDSLEGDPSTPLGMTAQ